MLARDRANRPIAKRRERRCGIGIIGCGKGIAAIAQPVGQKSTVKCIAHPCRINRLHGMGRNHLTRLRGCNHCALFAHGEGDNLTSKTQVKIANFFRSLQAGQLLRVIKTGQGEIGFVQGGMNDSPGAVKRP